MKVTTLSRALQLGTCLTITLAAAEGHANGRLPATVSVDSHASDFVLLPSTFGLLVSNDGGASFEWVCEANVGYGGTYDPDYAMSSTGDIWATTFEGLRVSRDRACTWTTMEGVLAGRFVSDVEVGSDGRIWVGSATGGQENDVFVSGDDGATFASAGLPEADVWWRSIRIASSDPNTVYVTGFSPMVGGTPPAAHLRKSVDGGQNWTTLDVSSFMFGDSPDLYIAAISPTDPDLVLARVHRARMPGDDLYRTTDGGATWTPVLQMNGAISALVIRADGQTVIAGTTENCIGDAPDLAKGCVRVSTDGGLTFAPASSEPKMACLHENGADLLACGANWDPDFFALGRSTDGGATWEKVVRFSELTGPLDCPMSSPQFECAVIDWPPLCTQLGICGSSDVDAGSTDAGVVAPKNGGCGCSVGLETPLESMALLSIVILLTFRRSTRSRPSPRTPRPYLVVVVVCSLPLWLGHGGGCGEDAAIEFGPPTGASCPPGGTDLTYEGFARPFFESYCLRCHSATVSGSERRGAPSDHNFDTQFEALNLRDHIDWMAGAGPNAVNEQMPTDEPAPTVEERELLSIWLACDAP